MVGGLKPYGRSQRTRTIIQTPKLIIKKKPLNNSLLQVVNMLVGSGREDRGCPT